MTPSIILVRPQMGENIGAAARAMANFGLRDLRLVAPRDGWPNVKASDTAGKALPIIDDARVDETVQAAVADCQFVLATTARERAMSLPVLDVRAAMAQLHARVARGEKCAILFGPERTGLENEDIALADAVVTIPVAPEYTSLNIGQAVVVCCYEWFSSFNSPHAGESLEQSERGDLESNAEPKSSLKDFGGGNVTQQDTPHQNAQERFGSPSGGEQESPAPREHLLGLLGQLELALDDVNFWRVPEKKDVMWRNIRTTLVRAGLSEQEVATWRGVVKALKGTP